MDEKFEKLSNAGNVPISYFNAAEIGLSVTDVVIIGKINDKQIQHIVIPHMVAKKISEGIKDALSLYETATDTKVGEFEKQIALLKKQIESLNKK